jgi:hypothetical protein
MRIGCGIRPAASHVRQVRSEIPHITAAVRAVTRSGMTSAESTQIALKDSLSLSRVLVPFTSIPRCNLLFRLL